MKSPKTFISYSWTSNEHVEWVIRLATALREQGVDVVLDKWDLREGHDAIAFMEQMVTKPEIEKVIVVCDPSYVEKADDRKGGVGTETQIISPAVYQKVDQDKFVAVIAERGVEGQPLVPTYLQSRIYIDMSSEDVYAQNYEQLLRWLYGKPTHPKPALGKPPSFLSAAASSSLGNSGLRKLAVDALRTARTNVMGIAEEYLETCAEGLEGFRAEGRGAEADEAVFIQIEAFLPARGELIEFFGVLARFGTPDQVSALMQDFFERIIRKLELPETRETQDWDADSLRFIIHELVLYSLSTLFERQLFQVAEELIARPYIVTRGYRGRETRAVSLLEVRHYLPSIEARNKRLGLSRLSLRADMLEQRSHTSGRDFNQVMQADLVLFLRGCAEQLRGQGKYWWPETLLYAQRAGALPLFVRAESQQFFKRLAPCLGVKSKGELGDTLVALRDEKVIRRPRWQFDSLNAEELVGFDKLSTRA